MKTSFLPDDHTYGVGTKRKPKTRKVSIFYKCGMFREGRWGWYASAETAREVMKNLRRKYPSFEFRLDEGPKGDG